MEDGYGFGRDAALGGIGGGACELSDATRSSCSVGTVRSTEGDLAPTIDSADEGLTRSETLCSWLRFRTRPCEECSSELFSPPVAKPVATRSVER